jgi:hypothetical protein
MPVATTQVRGVLPRARCFSSTVPIVAATSSAAPASDHSASVRRDGRRHRASAPNQPTSPATASTSVSAAVATGGATCISMKPSSA